MNKPTNSSQSSADKTWTIKEILDWSAGYLNKVGSSSARLDAEILLAETLNLKRIELYVNFERPLSPDERDDFRSLLKRRAQLEPIAYILGEKEFYGEVFKVTKDTLIPRPDTEHLVDFSVEYLKGVSAEEGPLKALEVGVGSGCIAGSILKNVENVSLVGWEVSSEALVVANENAQRLEIDSRFDVVNQDALIEEPWESTEQFDLIVSNPPYIDTDEVGVMAQETIKYEPRLALFAESKGLEFYSMFAKNAQKKLKPGAPIAVEIGYNQKASVVELFESNGWENVEVRQDYAGHPRVVIAFKP